MEYVQLIASQFIGITLALVVFDRVIKPWLDGRDDK